MMYFHIRGQGVGEQAVIRATTRWGRRGRNLQRQLSDAVSVPERGEEHIRNDGGMVCCSCSGICKGLFRGQ